jgi:hypothetical protein
MWIGGPSSVPETGIPYLSREGYPYRVFEKAHPDMVQAAGKLKIEDAIQSIVEAAGPISPKKLGSLSKLCFTPVERDRLQRGEF